MNRKLSRIAGGALALALVLTTAACGTTTPTGVTPIETDATTETTEIQIVEQPAEVGETVSYREVEASLDNAYLCSYTFEDNGQELAIIFYQMTITNNTDEDLCLNMLTQTFLNGADDALYPTTSLRSARMLSLQFGEGTEFFNDDLAPGETRQGYVYAEVPADFKVATLFFFPYDSRGDHSMEFSYEIAREDLTPAPDPVTPFE